MLFSAGSLDRRKKPEIDVVTDRLIYIIMGSVRRNRLSPTIADWVAVLGKKTIPAVTFEIIDLRDWPLPMDAEPDIPAHSGYSTDETNAWSTKVSLADAFVFVTPQYNWGYPAALKNAIDHLYREWCDKPAAIITYGGHGGGKCAAQLYQVLSGIKMHVVSEMPALTLAKSIIEANSGQIDASEAFAGQQSAVLRTLNALVASI